MSKIKWIPDYYSSETKIYELMSGEAVIGFLEWSIKMGGWIASHDRQPLTYDKDKYAFFKELEEAKKWVEKYVRLFWKMKSSGTADYLYVRINDETNFAVGEVYFADMKVCCRFWPPGHSTESEKFWYYDDAKNWLEDKAFEWVKEYADE